MIKHVILFTLKEEYTPEEKETIKAEAKAALEALAGKIPGLLEIKVNINGLPTSNTDLMLDSSFESVEALKGYAVHPDHVSVGKAKIFPFISARTCLDFEL